ncbi:hypothetical protein [Mangrovibacterium lignilyticum]|uniref:hypothetical protein n=1 Tax=Mangrovibacterium lignilyticum TaxID=2668052 RepID=UPI0013D3F997|nr:hypothetical protein [Mangrovibacterium lignilyticum]
MDKKNEHIIIQQFARLYHEWPKGKLQAGESPDFILKINTRKSIGIELTELKGQDFINHTGGLLNPTNIFAYLKETITAKNEKLVLYRRKKLYRIWLLIHVEQLTQNVNFNFQNKLENRLFHSDFDRVFLLEMRNERLFEL